MPELHRMVRTVTINRSNPFGPSHTVEEEDEYTITAETTGEIIVAVQAIEKEAVTTAAGMATIDRES